MFGNCHTQDYTAAIRLTINREKTVSTHLLKRHGKRKTWSISKSHDSKVHEKSWKVIKNIFLITV